MYTRQGSSRPSSSSGSRRGASPFGGGRNRSQGSSSGFSRGGSRGGFGGGRGRGGKKDIDIVEFIKRTSIIKEGAVVEPIKHSFSDFSFSTELKNNLAKSGFDTPTPIQDKAIPLVMQGGDFVGLASTGTGKTGAFLLPLIDKVLNDRTQKVIIMAPTRELALQIDTEFKKFAFGLKMYSATCVGGMPIYRQIKDLSFNPNFVIGTPGRIKDLYQRRNLVLEQFNNVVLDEVDHMLDLGFIEPIRNILSKINPQRQSLFFSATMPQDIKKLVSEFAKNPSTVEISPSHPTINVTQQVVRIKDKAMKYDQLHEILIDPSFEKVLIFSEMKRDVEKLANELARSGFKAESIHGDKRQSQRARALSNFKENRSNILVATDVAARGLDIKNISHVINYTIPQTYDDYIHRIGRTGRGNSKGTALTFI